MTRGSLITSRADRFVVASSSSLWATLVEDGEVRK